MYNVIQFFKDLFDRHYKCEHPKVYIVKNKCLICGKILKQK